MKSTYSSVEFMYSDETVLKVLPNLYDFNFDIYNLYFIYIMLCCHPTETSNQ